MLKGLKKFLVKEEPSKAPEGLPGQDLNPYGKAQKVEQVNGEWVVTILPTASPCGLDAFDFTKSQRQTIAIKQARARRALQDEFGSRDDDFEI